MHIAGGADEKNQTAACGPRAKERLNALSRILLEGPDRAGARAMLKAIGLTDEDLSKPLIGRGAM